MEQKKSWVAWVLLISGLFFTIFAAFYIKSEIDINAKKEFTYSSDEISNQIIRRLHAHAQILRSGAAFIRVSDTVTRAKWNAFIEESKIYLNLPGIQGIGFSIIIPANKLQQHIRKIRSEGFPDYTIKPAGKRKVYTSIIFLEPFSGRNLRAFGYDMFTEPVRREAMVRARDLDVAALSGKVMLVQETGTNVQAGNLMYVPVYRKGAAINTLDQRRHAIIGWVYSPYRMDDLMSGILEGWSLKENSKFFLRIFDGTKCTPQSILFESHALKEQRALENIRFTIQKPIDFNGHKWTLVYTQIKGSTFTDYLSAWTVLFGGILISLLLFFLARALINTENKAREKAELLTYELKESEKRFRNIFEVSPVPLVLTRISDGIVILANKLFNELFNISTAEIIGKKKADYYANHGDRGKILKDLVIEGSIKNREIQFKKEDGALFWTLASFQTLTLGDEQMILSGFYDITNRKLAEEEIQKLNRHNQRILSNVGEGIYGLDSFGKCTFINQLGARMLGYEIQELIGLQMHETNHYKKIDGSGYSWESCLIYQSITEGEVHRVSDEVFWRRDGTSFPVEYTATPIIENGEIRGVVVIFTDITERKKNEEAIRIFNSQLEQEVEKRTKELAETNLVLQKEIDERSQAEERTRLVYEASPYSIMVVDLDGIIRLANHTTELYFGYSLEQLIDANIDILVQKNKDTLNYLSDIRNYFKNPVNQKMALVKELFALKRDGSIFPIDIGLTPIEIDGEKMILANIIDITERKEAEDKINQAKLEAEEANLAKSEFLSRMSHELRTPLNSILGFAQLLNLEKLQPAQEKRINHITRSGKHLLELINEVLDISKIESGHLTLSLEPIALSPIVQEVIDAVIPLATEKKITIESTLPDKLFVEADRQRLKQILLNLIGNAIKYNIHNGFVKIECKLPSAAAHHDRTVEIRITDSGRGISRKDIKKIFTPFERIGAEKTKTEGTGLGLAVVKELTEAMHGAIGVQSKVGHGSTFWIELPQTETQGEQVERLNHLGPELKRGDLNGTILYIEDNISNIQLVEQIVETHLPGIHLVTEMFGKNTVKLAKDLTPRLILLDLDLPDMPGGEVLKLLKANHETAVIPVIILSADAMVTRIEKLFTLGAEDYLTKPFEVLEFLKIVEGFLSRKK